MPDPHPNAFATGRTPERGVVAVNQGLLGLLVAALVAPLAATLIQLAVSRAREFEADASAAAYTGTPHGLIGALRTLERGAALIPSTTARPATAHLSIVNPLAGGAAGGFARLFSTHPPTSDRVAALRALDLTAQPRRSTLRRPILGSDA